VTIALAVITLFFVITYFVQTFRTFFLTNHGSVLIAVERIKEKVDEREDFGWSLCPSWASSRASAQRLINGHKERRSEYLALSCHLRKMDFPGQIAWVTCGSTRKATLGGPHHKCGFIDKTA
jgi:hypothetical protein